jgi:hypothetical protein
VGAKRWQLYHLVPTQLAPSARWLALEAVTAAAALFRLHVDHYIHLIERLQASVAPWMPRLSAPLAT